MQAFGSGKKNLSSSYHTKEIPRADGSNEPSELACFVGMGVNPEVTFARNEEHIGPLDEKNSLTTREMVTLRHWVPFTLELKHDRAAKPFCVQLGFFRGDNLYVDPLLGGPLIASWLEALSAFQGGVPPFWGGHRASRF